MSTAIARGLIRIATAIGRWILGVAVRRGALFLRDYMDERVVVFRSRLGRSRTKRRRLWLTGRIRRWAAAVRWLSAEAAQLGRCAQSEFDALRRDHKGLPLTASCERLARV